jgi:hypothetical protein
MHGDFGRSKCICTSVYIVCYTQTHVLHLILKSLLVDYLARDLNHQEGSKCTIL